jgi:hypothetical protein
MRQDKIYNVDLPSGKNFYFVVDATTTGIVIFLFNEEPSKYTEAEQSVAVVQLDVEPDADATRVQLRLWDDETDHQGDATQIITVVLQER